MLGLRFNFGSILHRFWSPKWLPNGVQNRFKVCLRLPGASRGLQEAILEPFWLHLGIIFSDFPTSGAPFQAPWPVWGAVHWRSGHGALVAPLGP